MIAFLPWVVLVVLVQIVHGWGFHASCSGIEQPLRDGMAIAFQRASEATREIKRTPRNKHVDALLQLLFGGDASKILDASFRLQAVQFLDVFSATKPEAYDVLIFCSTDRLVDWNDDKTGARIGYIDPERGGARVRGTTMMDNCRSTNRDGDASTRAITVNIGSKVDKNGKNTVETQPDAIQLCPWYLRQLAGPPPTYITSDELVKKAGDVKAKNVLGKLGAKLTGDIATPIDSLAGFEHVLLHEMTHSATAGYSDDKPVGKCYGWKHSGKCQESENADSLAYFALAVELVLHKGFTVNKDGTLQKIS